MSNVIMPGDYGFNGKFFQQLPTFFRTDYFWVIYASVFDWFKDGCEAALVARIVLDPIVLDKVLRLLVDGIVGQMHAQVVQIAT